MTPSTGPVAVAGGTGVLGRQVVEVLRRRGVAVRVLSRSAGVDLRGGPPDLAGVDAVVDCLNVATLRRAAAEDFFAATSAALVAAVRRDGVRHHVVVSIVGIDRVDSGYYAGKRRQEQVVLDGGGPATVVRATQFHEFAEQVLARAALGPVHLVPRMRVQPAAAREVGEVVAELALGPVLGRAPEVAGPQVHELPDLARRVLAARGRRGLVVPVRPPGAAGRAMAGDGLLPRGQARQTRTAFDDWLATAPAPARAARR